MSLRAIILGTLLALAIAAATYFNDQVVHNNHLVASHLPPSVFGVLVILMLMVNPTLGMIHRRLALRSSELLLIAALALSVCGYPGSGFFRFFMTNQTVPTHQYASSSWFQSVQLINYVPGASAQLADGHVQDPRDLARMWVREKDQPLQAKLWLAIDEVDRRALEQVVGAAGPIQWQQHQDVRRALNRAIERLENEDPAGYPRPLVLDVVNTEHWSGRPSAAVVSWRQAVARLERARERRTELAERLKNQEHAERPREQLHDRMRWQVHRVEHAEIAADRAAQLVDRWAIHLHWPEHVMPPARGSHGVLLGRDRVETLVNMTVRQGWDGAEPLGLARLPWAELWPAIRIWGGLIVLLSLASLCLALIVHPQWARREMLPFPIARFATELVESAGDGWRPRVMGSRLFWCGLLAMIVLHLNNGLAAWFPGYPFEIALSFDMTPLRDLLPNAARVGNNAQNLFEPRFYPSVVAFTFFLATQVSFSVGIAGFLYMAMAAVMISQGVSMGEDRDVPVRFGAFLGMVIVLAYTGRHYYAAVMWGALGARVHEDIPAGSRWAARALVLCIALATWLLWDAGLGWGWALTVILGVLMIFLVIARLNAEAGVFFAGAGWAPAWVLTALLGFDAIGPTALLVMGIAGIMLVGNPRETAMGFMVNALHLYGRSDPHRPARLAPKMAVLIVVGFGVALAATLYHQFNRGMNLASPWATEGMPRVPLNHAASEISDAVAMGNLSEIVRASGLEKFALVNPDTTAWLWLSIGLALVLGCTLARLRLPWWPLHPLAFIVWNQYTTGFIAWSFLLGWFIKSSVVGLGGQRMYNVLKPLAIGVVAGELLMLLAWMAVGAIYFGLQGVSPTHYDMFVQ